MIKFIFCLWMFSGLYLFLFFSNIIFFFYKNTTLTNFLWQQFGKMIFIVGKITGIHNKIKILKGIEIDKDNWGIIIANHTSIVDNFVIDYISCYKNSLNWNHFKTVSKVSSKKWQNTALNHFDCLLQNINQSYKMNIIQFMRKKKNMGRNKSTITNHFISRREDWWPL
tara:strand:+ start:659 stop:1162 length:504 start_codon:yes stop_codon:yes gene_type:complete